MLQWHWRSFAELTNYELYDILALRQNVFNIEQVCAEPDIDNLDQAAMHLMGVRDNELVTYLRLFLPGAKYPDKVSLGRFVTVKSARGQGLGKEAAIEALTYLKKMNVVAPIEISAQLYLEKAYANFGFVRIGEPFDEGGIMHVAMLKNSL